MGRGVVKVSFDTTLQNNITLRARGLMACRYRLPPRYSVRPGKRSAWWAGQHDVYQRRQRAEGHRVKVGGGRQCRNGRQGKKQRKRYVANEKLTLFILMALGTTSAWASCWQSNSAYEINMAMGRVVVSPDLPVECHYN